MKNDNKKYSKTLDEMMEMIKTHLKENPDKFEYRDNQNPYYKEGYRRALEDFMLIASWR